MPQTEPPWVNTRFIPVSPEWLLESAALQFLHACLVEAPHSDRYPIACHDSLTYRYLPLKLWDQALGLGRSATERLLSRLLEQDLIRRQQLHKRDYLQGYSYALTTAGHQRLLATPDSAAR
jgi:hypothetical protein